jgi:phage portal protein BeeE
MGMIDRLRARLTPVPAERAYWPFVNVNGNTYPVPFFNQTLTGTKEEIESDFAGLGAGTLKANPVVFACMQARSSLFSEARFMYRQLRSGTPGELFSLADLEILRHPWPGGTTGDLLARTMQDNDLAGNAFWLRRPGRLVRLRPDWVTIVHGSRVDPNVTMWDPEAELLGYLYQPGGPASGRQPIADLPTEVAHFAPTPDPLAPQRGMSWLTPLIREIQADSQMTTHKQAYLTNGATPNLVLTGVPGTTPATYQEWVDAFSRKHDGARNAYKSLYLTAAMDAKVLGSNMEQIDFKAVQGAGETRIATAAGVPAAVIGISEGLAGSSLNAGNFQSSMRRFADLTMRPLWRNACGSFERIIAVPTASELWYDDRDIPALKDDIKDYAEVQSLQATAVRQYVDAGFDPDAVVDAINAGDLKRLRHTGLYSVQLQPPLPEQGAAPVAPEPVA